jgi:hypothetical protein
LWTIDGPILSLDPAACQSFSVPAPHVPLRVLSPHAVLIFIATVVCMSIPTPATANGSCRLPDGWSAVVKPEARFIIFGELHGTEQSPEMVGDVVCALSRAGKHVLLGVELQATSNPGLQKAWASAEADFASTLIASMPDWSKRNDGVASRAMLAMLTRLHSLKTAGRHIDVVAFNGMRDDAQTERFRHLAAQRPHEAAQAENIRLADAGHYDRVIVLAGSLHARKNAVQSRNIAGEWFKPMAMHLAPPDKVISLRMAHEKGVSWDCESISLPGQEAGPIDCGPHETRDFAALAGPPRIVSSTDLPASVSDVGSYDGYFFVGQVTASPPVMGNAHF